MKYAVAMRRRRNRLPYSLVAGKVVIQVGAPHDTLHSGRSRGFSFAQLAGQTGRVVIIEPNPESVRQLRVMLKRFGLNNTTVVESGVWSASGRIRIYIDPEHPATSFTEGTVGYPPERLKDYQLVEVDCRTIDGVVQELGLDRVDLLSVTTNWAEREILKGAAKTLSDGVKFVSLAQGAEGDTFDYEMGELGYQLLGEDDRGVTYRRI